MAIPLLRGRSVVVPSAGQQHLRCGRCGGLDFGVHVEPLPGPGPGTRGGAVAREAVCRGCRKVYRLRPDLTFEQGGKSSNLKGEWLT